MGRLTQRPLPLSPRPRDATTRVRRRTTVTSVRIIRSCYFAFAGLGYLFRTQRNARIHAVIGTAACGLAAWLHVSRVEWAVLVFTIALVLILEGINTAVEAAIDLASPQVHPLAKAAKDLAAGRVLIGAFASFAVGLLMLGRPLWHRVFP